MKWLATESRADSDICDRRASEVPWPGPGDGEAPLADFAGPDNRHGRNSTCPLGSGPIYYLNQSHAQQLETTLSILNDTVATYRLRSWAAQQRGIAPMASLERFVVYRSWELIILEHAPGRGLAQQNAGLPPPAEPDRGLPARSLTLTGTEPCFPSHSATRTRVVRPQCARRLDGGTVQKNEDSLPWSLIRCSFLDIKCIWTYIIGDTNFNNIRIMTGSNSTASIDVKQHRVMFETLIRAALAHGLTF